jgi:hypothetical protein
MVTSPDHAAGCVSATNGIPLEGSLHLEHRNSQQDQQGVNRSLHSLHTTREIHSDESLNDDDMQSNDEDGLSLTHSNDASLVVKRKRASKACDRYVSFFINNDELPSQKN